MAMNNNKQWKIRLARYLLVVYCILGLSAPALADRLKDMTSIAGVRDNFLIGYGLVVGLDGTGDQTTQTPFTTQSFINLLKKFGIGLPPGTNMQTKNMAAVAIHADMPPFVKPGQKIDITVSSIGNAKSLRGGTLLLTPLRGIDGEVYAIAQGNVVVGGVSAEGKSGSKIVINTPTSGRIPGGATLEREVVSDFSEQQHIVLNLRKPSFTTAKNIAREVNNIFGPEVAVAKNNVRINIRAPKDSQQRVVMMSMLEEISVVEGRKPARIVFNSRTGTVVIGKSVKVSEAAVSHGNLTVTIAESQQVSQPNAFADGETTVVDQSQLDVSEERAQMAIWPPGTELNTIVNAVNSLGATPTDLMSILQALHEAGALNAELVVI